MPYVIIWHHPDDYYFEQIVPTAEEVDEDVRDGQENGWSHLSTRWVEPPPREPDPPPWECL